MSFIKSLACALAFACAVPAANAAVITFDKLATTTTAGGIAYASYGYTYFFSGAAATVNGFTFTSNANAYFMGPAYSTASSATAASPYNGTDYYMAYSGFVMKAADQSAFSLSSVDLGYWSGSGTAITTLTGTRPDGTTVTQSLTAVINNSANANDFSTLVLNDFTNLASVKFTSTSSSFIAIDNLVVNASTAVPEPASLAMIGLGLAALAALRRRKA